MVRRAVGVGPSRAASCRGGMDTSRKEFRLSGCLGHGCTRARGQRQGGPGGANEKSGEGGSERKLVVIDTIER